MFFDEGRVNEAYNLMIRNIDKSVDMGAEEVELYAEIKAKHTLLVRKMDLVRDKNTWKKYSSVSKTNKNADGLRICVAKNSKRNFLVEVDLDCARIPGQALVKKLEFADSWLEGISSSKLIKRINGNCHIVLLQVSNPLLSYFQATPLYVQVDFFDDSNTRENVNVVIVTTLSHSDCEKHKIAMATPIAPGRFFVFSALTFVILNCEERTKAKVLVENMQSTPFIPKFLNTVMCVDLFISFCALWANTGRKLDEGVHDGIKLANLVDYITPNIQTTSIIDNPFS
jgi:hypothetical protein